MAQPFATFAEKWNAEIDQIDNGDTDTPGSSFDFANFNGDEQSVRRLREYGQSLTQRAATEDARLGQSLSSLDSLVRSKFCLSDYRQKEIEVHRVRLQKLRDQKEEDEAMIKRFQRENASLCTRLKTYEEDDDERVKMEEELRRTKRVEEDRLRLQRTKLQQALDIAQGVSSPTVAQLRSRFDSPSNEQPSAAMKKKAPVPAPITGQSTRRNLENGPGFYNPKYRRSQSASRVVDHRPAISIPTGTILRPKMGTNAKTTVAPKANLLHKSDGYVLTHQDVDDLGNVSTSIIKGDCIPTAGGGTAVCFNDIEHLSQESAATAPDLVGKRRRNRSSKKTVRF